MNYDAQRMREMQNEAKQRVMEMHARSLQTKSRMEKELALEETAQEPFPQNKRFVGLAEEPKNYKMPVELTPVSQNEEISANGHESLESALQAQNHGEPDKTPRDSGMEFGSLSQEELEKMFLLSLSLLLSHEQADEGVLLALMYLAM